MKFKVMAAVIAAATGIASAFPQKRTNQASVRRQSKAEANEALKKAQEKRDLKAARNLRNAARKEANHAI